MNKLCGLYVHLPFCLKKCAYCDFVSYENCLSEGENYVSHLLSEMEAYRGEPIDTVYLGGGTPTALPPHLLVRLLDGVKACFLVQEEAEITVEANPGTCDEYDLLMLREAGVNRISIGAQSFNDNELSVLGRIHTAEDTKEAVCAARRAGISNLSLDLMFSLPNQNWESLSYSLEEITALSPDHISCYSLTLSETTPLYRAVTENDLTLPDEERDRYFYGIICETLEEKGYGRYEISNFARCGRESRHNTKYWMRAPYIGLGAAAHSFYGGRRFENPPQLSKYYELVEKGLAREGEIITETDAMAEYMFLGLRMTAAGVRRDDFFAQFGKTIDELYGDIIKKFCWQGLLEDRGDSIRLTDKGIDLSNMVFCEFV